MSAYADALKAHTTGYGTRPAWSEEAQADRADLDVMGPREPLPRRGRCGTCHAVLYVDERCDYCTEGEYVW